MSAHRSPRCKNNFEAFGLGIPSRFAAEILDNLESALEQFRGVVEELGERV